MKSYFSKKSGFTLLEMLVVLLLTSLLAALLMQGFIYLTSTYSVIERRQYQFGKENLLSGWVRYSLQGVVPGLAGEEVKNLKFAGDRTSIEGISQSSLAQDQTVPVRILWQLKEVDNRRILQYTERPLYTNQAGITYQMAEWPITVPAAFSYYSNEKWTDEFPPRTSLFMRIGKRALPNGIKLAVGAEGSIYTLIVHVGGSKEEYRPLPEEWL